MVNTRQPDTPGPQLREVSAMGYHLDGPLGRFTECLDSPRRDGEPAPATSPLRDILLVGLTALGARLQHESGGPHGRRQRR